MGPPATRSNINSDSNWLVWCSCIYFWNRFSAQRCDLRGTTKPVHSCLELTWEIIKKKRCSTWSVHVRPKHRNSRELKAPGSGTNSIIRPVPETTKSTTIWIINCKLKVGRLETKKWLRHERKTNPRSSITNQPIWNGYKRSCALQHGQDLPNSIQRNSASNLESEC